MVGTFAQPDGGLIDPEVLRTLGQRELIEGWGEVIKYGLIEDPALWEEVEEWMAPSSLSMTIQNP